MKKFYTYEEQIEHLKKKGLVIALHYLLPKEEFKSFVIGLDAVLTAHFSTLPSATASKIQERMGFPENWKDILKY